MSVKPLSAASVVAHRRRTAERSSSGGGDAPRRVVLVRVGACPVVFVFWVPPSPSFRDWLGFGDATSRSTDGRMSFFCLDAGRISSRSTGTPSETRKSRRMRDLTQFCGWRGGGATSWDQRESERSVLKIAEESGIGSTGERDSRS